MTSNVPTAQEGQGQEPGPGTLFVPVGGRGATGTVDAEQPLNTRALAILRRLALTRGVTRQIRVYEGGRPTGAHRFRSMHDFVWPPGSPLPATDLKSEGLAWEELAGLAPGLVVRDGGGEGCTLQQLYPNARPPTPLPEVAQLVPAAATDVVKAAKAKVKKKRPRA